MTTRPKARTFAGMQVLLAGGTPEEVAAADQAQLARWEQERAVEERERLAAIRARELRNEEAALRIADRRRRLARRLDGNVGG